MSVSRILLGVVVALVAGHSEAVLSGYLVPNPTEFPYFVHIVTTPQTGAVRQCSGSVVSDRWVVTTLSCVQSARKIMLYFGVYELDKIAFTKHLEVEMDHVVPYPTMADDIALILLPEKLQFSSNIQPIEIADYMPKEGLGVVVGFQSGQNILRYGFFRVQSPEVCLNAYRTFDLYKQICTTGWTNPYQRPCKGNEGSGLIVDWPRNPRLAGIFSQTSSCSGTTPALYVGLESYLFWIRSEIVNTPPVPTTTPPSTSDSV